MFSVGGERMKKSAIEKSIDGNCPYCGSDKVFIRGRVNPRSSTFPKPKKGTFCAKCDREYLPKLKED